MTTTTETRRFEAEVQELLGLMIHSLYTQKDIFLRELISNASDALDKLHIRALTEKDLLPEGEALGIRLEVDEKARTLSVIDNGIGMDREELAENLGTIARSGTRHFLETVQQAGKDAATELIGQFGVGFYSSFMVADEVVVESKKAGADGRGARWTSRADGEYQLEDADLKARGTRVTLHLKAPTSDEAGDGESIDDYLDSHRLRAVVKRHSDFVEYPIRMDVEEWETEKDDDGKPKEGAEPQKVMRTRVVNSQKPLWSRPRKDVERSEYIEFYRHLAHDFEEPLDIIHLKAEVPVEYGALLFVPAQRPPAFLAGPREKSQISLYARRVLIMSDCEDLLPPWLRFVRGVVECSDLPLNISRQTLQTNPVTQRIRKHLVSKVLAALGKLLEKEREKYAGFFEHFGSILKEGIYHGGDDDNRISRLCLFATSQGGDACTLPEYVERMPVAQPAIYYITGLDKDRAAASPHLEAFRAKGYEVLLLSDPVDEWMLQRLPSFDGKDLKPVDHGEVDLEGEEEKKVREEKQESHKDLLEAMAKVLAEADVSEVRYSSRLKDSPAVLVSAEGAPSPAMERVLREVHGEMPSSKRALELNPEHALVAKLRALYEADPEGERFLAFTHLVHGQALITEGSPLPDPARFAALLTELMVADEDPAS